ncbi:hypothetical protein PANT_15c00035 [Moesziomyces antarcticus T-34]|uniref:Uncharacterized protein n=1 Tax=Pseudozyma antarctica (strain T-34) TaxID=1151754 RepID=M9M4L0_PSEA3|nr:hypothetical protein PANT_15c00035 [Moesziomyces antarcticus T-34]
MTVHSPTAGQARHFRPVRYQTKEEIDRFFGTTTVQKREQRLRVREADGHVYFDWIEKDEWQHLLATGSLTSPSSADARRRSSTATCLTLNSPLTPLSPARRNSAAPGSASLSPLVVTFNHVAIDSTDSMRNRRRRKRSDSDVAMASNRVDNFLPYTAHGERSFDWAPSPAFKRRQSDSYDPLHTLDAPFNREAEAESQHDGNKIRIKRLPLEHRRLDQHTLDQAFAVHDPLLDLAPDASLAGSRAHKPPTLLLPDPFRAHAQLEHDDACSTASSLPCSPNPSEYAYSTFDVGSHEPRRGTFGALEPPPRTPVQLVAAPSRRMRHHSDTAATPPSSAAMEVLNSPAVASPKPQRTLRHAVSFDDAPRLPPLPVQEAGVWAQRQRWHSAGNESKLRAERSCASLRSQLLRRTRTLSESDDTACFTPLAPRTGAKKFDPTRHMILSSLEHLSDATSSVAEAPRIESEAQPAKAKVGTGLRTGAHVYDGVDIPCASIHLHSDPEDNFAPAIALSLSAHKLRKLRKKHSTPPPDSPTHSRSASLASHPKGSSRWWNHILHA